MSLFVIFGCGIVVGCVVTHILERVTTAHGWYEVHIPDDEPENPVPFMQVHLNNGSDLIAKNRLILHKKDNSQN